MDELGRLEQRLERFRKSKELSIACVGAVYLDILIDGIELINGQHILDFNEEIPVEITGHPGGSAYFVAYYLHQLSLTAKIVSVIGKDDYGNTFLDIAKRETAPLALDGIIRAKGKTAITVHLISPSGETAMYTDRDVLRSLTWDDVGEQLHQNRCVKGLIYIAGIFKTNLHRQLAKNLTDLKNEGGIICLDHGRLHFGQHTNSRRRSLQQALPLVDFYFTTRKELSQYLSLITQKQKLADKLQSLNKPINEILPEIVEEAEDIFPPVTIINDNNSEFPARLVVLRKPDHKFAYTLIPTSKFIKPRQSHVGFGNMFQAVFIHNLIKSPTEDYQKLIPESAKLAQHCLEWTCARMDRTIAEAMSNAPKLIPTQESTQDKISIVNKIELLEDTLRERVSLDELHSICLALDIDFDDLPGETMGRKTVSLLTHLQKTKSLNALLQWLSRHRPDINISGLEG